MKFLSVAIFCFVLTIVLLLAKTSNATEYYVNNKSGNDANIGSMSAPLKSISMAMEKVDAGDTVIIISSGADYPYTESIELKKSGFAGSVITIRGESKDKKPIIKGNDLGEMLQCYGKHYIRVKNIVFKDSKYSGLGFANGCTNIELENLEIYDCKKNGILVNGGGHDFVISNCIIKRIGNTGIAFMGSKFNKLHDTIVEGCMISDVYTNDGISLHKDEYGNDVGTNHMIRGNTVSNCYEQGVDITAGSKIVVENNVTFDNHDSGVLIDHGVSNVHVNNHKSEKEGKYGIIIGNSKDIIIKNSFFLGPVKNTIIQIVGCENLIIEGSHFEAAAGSSNRKIIDIGVSPNSVTKNLVFRNNTFLAYAGNNSTGMMLRYLGCNPNDVSVSWESNVWYSNQNQRKVFYDAENGIYNFETFRNKFAPNDVFSHPTVQFAAPKILKLQ